MSKQELTELWPYLDEEFDPEEELLSRSAGKNKQKKAKTTQAVTTDEQLAILARQDNNPQDFDFTYKASRYEGGWLLDSLRNFYEQHWISDVLRMVKGGKEASVYLCRGDQSAAQGLLAAKVYRPRSFRSLKNDALYREGRAVLDTDGNEILDGRMHRAMRKRTDFGLELLHSSWLEHEYTVLEKLHAAGADVPKPYANDTNAILMTYFGDELLGAPTLNTVQLERAEAQVLFERVIRNIELMLANERIHGDLSAYNILYWQGEITLIDFPQAIHPEGNRSAYRIFQRDVQRVCEYFSRQGVDVNHQQLARELWTSHNYRLRPDVHPAILDAEDEQDMVYWESLQDEQP
jgi:RIO kinase 1